MAKINCAGGCDTGLPPVKFDECKPNVNFSEIKAIYITRNNAPGFTDVTDPTEWAVRLSEAGTAPNAIRKLTVAGDKPAATAVVAQISGFRDVNIGKDHVVNFTVDDVSDENYDFARYMDCGGLWKIWYETHGGYIYGDNEGIKNVKIDMNDVLERGREAFETVQGVATWREKIAPARARSPFADNTEAPLVLDTTLTFSDSVTDTAFLITGTVTAVTPVAKFEFNKIDGGTSGVPFNLDIYVNNVLEIVITGVSDYFTTNSTFRYTDLAGNTHVATFKGGEYRF